MVSASLDRIKETEDVAIHWRSFELRPAGAPPMSAEYRARIEQFRPQLEETAAKQYGLSLNPGPFGIDSRVALIGAKFAEKMGKGEAYHDAVFRAYWQQGKNIEERSVLGVLVLQVGLDEQAFLLALEDGGLQTAVDEDIQFAHTHGLNSVPALVFADKYLVSGAQPYEVLLNVLRQVEESNV